MAQDTRNAPETPEGSGQDQLSELLRRGAWWLIEEAGEAEFQEFLAAFREQCLEDGHQRVVRNGYLPERERQTGLGAVAVQIPKVRDRASAGVKFNSTLVPPYTRRTPSVEAVLPWLYLKGLSTGDFTAALHALLGEEAKGLSPTTSVGSNRVGRRSTRPGGSAR